MEANPNESRKKNARKNPLDENLGSINEEEVKEEVKEEEEEEEEEEHRGKTNTRLKK